jgi:acyl-CoA thioester hydrolase
MSFRFSKRVEVRFRDCDPLGHVNNAVYATYFEIARFSYWREALGYSEGDGFLFIMARVECNFRSQARVGELLDVQLRLSGIGRTSFTFDYRVVEATDGRLVADGSSVQVMFDYPTQRPVPVSEDFRARVSRYEQVELQREDDVASPS